MYGLILAVELKPLHVTRWLDAHPGWKGNRRNAVVAVKRVLNWAEAEGVMRDGGAVGMLARARDLLGRSAELNQGALP